MNLNVNRSRRIILLACLTVLILIRVPELTYPGRFWAEEGTVYFREAYVDSPMTVLSRSNLGYYSLFNKLSCILAARIVPLTFAPVVTALCALLAQLLPLVLLLFSRVGSFASRTRLVGAALVILLVQPNQEVWLNTINSQFFLCVATGIILISEPINRSWHLIRLSTLILAGLTGVTSCMLLPLFIFELLKTRSRQRLQEVLTLGFASAIQGAIVISQAGRESAPYWSVLPFALLAKQWMLPYLGSKASSLFGAACRHYQVFVIPGLPLLALVPHAIAGLGLAIWGRRESFLIYLAGIGIASLSFLFAVEAGDPDRILVHVSPFGAGRYYYAPNVFLALAVMMSPRTQPLWGERWRFRYRSVCLILVILLLVVGGFEFISSKRRQWFFSGPSWATEVGEWEKRGTGSLRIWPQPWLMNLPQPGSDTTAGDSQDEM